MDWQPFSTTILILYKITFHSQEQVCLIMDNFITHRLHVETEKEQDIHSATCKTGDQLMVVITLASIKTGTDNMQTQRRQRLMCQDSSTIQDSQTKKGDGMDKESNRIQMEIYILVDGRKPTKPKERCTCCKGITVTHSSMSNMMKKRMRQREEK